MLKEKSNNENEKLISRLHTAKESFNNIAIRAIEINKVETTKKKTKKKKKYAHKEAVSNISSIILIPKTRQRNHKKVCYTSFPFTDANILNNKKTCKLNSGICKKYNIPQIKGVYTRNTS